MYSLESLPSNPSLIIVNLDRNNDLLLKQNKTALYEAL